MKTWNQFQFNCDRLWKLWYSILVILMQFLLICLAISNYLTYKSQTFDPRHGSNWSMMPLNFQLGSIILSFSLLVWLIYSCVFKIGHAANDGVELGLDSSSIKKALEDISSHRGVELFLSRLMTHALPYNCLIHLIIALLLALPVPLMQAEQIKMDAISPGYLWTTNIDFLRNPHDLRRSQDDTVMCHKHPCEFPTKPSKISPEFINLVISLLIIVIRLPAPFWYTNKAFSIVFSLFAFISASCISMEYESLILIIKVINNQQITKEFIDPYFPGWVILIIFLFKSLLMLFMLIIVFEYGYTQYLSNMRKYRQYFSSDISDSVSQQSLNNNQIKWYQVAPRFLGTIIIIFIKALKIPVLYAQISYLKSSNHLRIHPTIVIGISVSLFYFMACIFLWFGLCVKNKWQFHINIQTNPIPNICPTKIAGSPEPVYGCFYNAPSGSSQISFSKPMLRSSIEGSDVSNNNIRNVQSGNYVLMHSGINSSILSGPIHEHLQYNRGDSEVSFESNTKSYDSGDNRYKRNQFYNVNMDNSQYATLASLQSGAILPTKSMSDTSSNENYAKNQSRRGSNRVTFKEENNLNYQIAYPFNYPTNNSVSRVPDILSISNNGNFETSNVSSSPHGFDPDLEMSTDMRQNEDLIGRDPRLCSQV